MATIRLSAGQVTQLVDLPTTAAAAADTSDEDRYQLHYSRHQVHREMPWIEVLVLAGVLADMTDRPGPDQATRTAYRWWSAELARLLSIASAEAAAASSQHPSSTGRGPQALRPAA